MATYLTTITVGAKKYHISHNGTDLYFSSSNKTGGSSLKGLKFKNNEIIKNSDNKVATEYDIAEAIKKSQKSSGCFISTVVYETIKDQDDCHELILLRKFRDEVMLRDDSYSRLVDEYYAISPSIAEKLSQVNDKKLCEYLSDNFIKQSIELISKGENVKAIEVYMDMVGFLERYFEN